MAEQCLYIDDLSNGKIYEAGVLLKLTKNIGLSVSLKADQQTDRRFLQKYPWISLDRSFKRTPSIKVIVHHHVDSDQVQYQIMNDDGTINCKYADPNAVYDQIKRSMSSQDFSGKSILISTGPTVEDIDPVRFITNRSSGKMGIAMARAAFQRAADVQLVSGPISQKVPECIPTENVRSAWDMNVSVNKYFKRCDIYIGIAAVADYTPASYSEEKIKKQENNLQLSLKRTTDIINALSLKKKHQLLIGFSVETENVIENSINKLNSKGLDLIVINNPKETSSAFAGDTNKITIIDKLGQVQEFPIMLKSEVAHRILDVVKNYMDKSLKHE